MDEIIDNIRSSNTITQDDSFGYGQLCSKLLRNPKEEHLARRIIINILDNWDKLDAPKGMLIEDVPLVCFLVMI